MDGLVFLGNHERKMRMDAVVRKVERKCTKYQLVHHLALIHLQVEVDFGVSMSDLSVSIPSNMNRNTMLRSTYPQFVKFDGV